MKKLYEVYRVNVAGLEEVLNTMASKKYWAISITPMLDTLVVVFMFAGSMEEALTEDSPDTQVVGVDLITPTTRVG